MGMNLEKIIALILMSSLHLFANDSEYYTSGNQLIPLEYSNVRLDKEVLTIKHLGGMYSYSVDVKYELFNEGEAKDTLIGFEAPGQVGEAEPQMFFAKKYNDKELLKTEKESIANKTYTNDNEYITDFKVTVNGKQATYKVVFLDSIKKDKHTSPFVGSLYYFPAHLKKGLNSLHHTYHFDGDNTILFFSCEFKYILETAKRWKGGKIKEFTLILDMGENKEFDVAETFFNGTKNWEVKDGIIKHIPATKDRDAYEKFYTYEGKAIFKKKNFVPNSVLFLHGAKQPYDLYGNTFDAEEYDLPFSFSKHISKAAVNIESLRILKTYPYARKGAIFKKKSLHHYYKKLMWYRENPNYRKSFESLEKDEKEWLAGIEKFKHKVLRNLPYARRGYVFKDSDLNAFFEHKKWYSQNQEYKAKPSDLSKKELVWLKMIKKKEISDKAFFDDMEKYEKIYK